MTPYTDHHTPDGVRVRGTVIVVPGRGETPAVYGRLGRRLAADAYRVRVLDTSGIADGTAPESLTALAARISGTVRDTATADGVARPLVLLGADTGAAAVAALLDPGRGHDTGGPDAVILAGLPAPGTAAGGTWEEELDARTACPVHRGTLTDDPAVRRGALTGPAPDALLTAAHASRPAVPALFLTGDADPLADPSALARTVKALPLARLSTVRGARHDVLNDQQHRSVAAEIVTFLETVRAHLVPVIGVESSAW
ncbi:lysophospholipase [Streptomyces sp. J2-1]|uniref:alpha/beta hydrolase n=1 Tax=Streptomyces corallincola TaxID=2851888 RepID=UPI001C38771E|nr:alpha/beta hydrolase [Streptomyces corallincola]MBV2356735.1 lysophospholipase [Streptomyces corallincola]